MLDVRRASPETSMGAQVIETHVPSSGSCVLVQDVGTGPLYQSGLIAGDILLTVQNFNVETLEHFNSIVQGKTDMQFVVKRMSQKSQDGKGRRENKMHTCNITISNELGLGLQLKEVKSGTEESKTFLYVKELREYPNGDPGPGLVAGVRQYDLVLRINDVAIHTIADAQRAIQGQQTAKCEVRRMIHRLSSDQGDTEEVILTFAVAPDKSLGLSLTEAYRAKSVDPVLVVTNVRGGSAAERAGIKLRDIVCQVEGKDITILDDLKEKTRGLEKFKITVRRESSKSMTLSAPSSKGPVSYASPLH